ncbi:MAG: restriction endonuclease subunit S [Bacteroidales bacterium]|nr:restriction endonuclease subunit S [Bacteroidales bacterium]
MEKQKKIPKLRFPEFEGEWIQEKLDDVASKIQDGTHFSPELLVEGKFLYITSKNVKNGYIDLSDSYYVSYEDHKNIYKRCDTKKGDVLLTKDGTIGQASINTLSEEISLLSSVAFIRAKDKYLNEFICQLLLSPEGQREIKKSIAGQALKRITLTKIKNFNYYFPSLPEQQKIASFFTAIDQKISQLKRKLTLLEEYKKGVMQKIFSQEIRFRDDNGQEFPKWEKKRLGELTYKTGKKNKGSTPYPIYSINNREGFLPQGDQFEGVDSNSRGYDISLYKIIEEKTFAYNPARINVGSIGFSGDLKDIIISSLYVCFKTKQGLEDAYLLHYLKTFQFNKSVLQNVEGGVRDYLFYENFSNIKINLPSNKEQLKIANFLSTIDDKINHTQKQINKAEVWKKGLMQQMFV